MTSPSLPYDALRLEAEHLRRPHRRSSQKTPKTKRQPCSNAARVMAQPVCGKEAERPSGLQSSSCARFLSSQRLSADPAG